MLSVVLITVPDQETAELVAKAVLEPRLAACVNILPAVRSLYWWEGKIDSSNELLLIAKTEPQLIAELSDAVRAVHPYKIPEIVALSASYVAESYLGWVKAETKK